MGFVNVKTKNKPVCVLKGEETVGERQIEATSPGALSIIREGFI